MALTDRRIGTGYGRAPTKYNVAAGGLTEAQKRAADAARRQALAAQQVQVQAEAGWGWEQVAEATGTEVGDVVKANPSDTDVKGGNFYNVPPQPVNPYPLGNLPVPGDYSSSAVRDAIGGSWMKRDGEWLPATPLSEATESLADKYPNVPDFIKDAPGFPGLANKWDTTKHGADVVANSLLKGSYLTERYANKAMYDISHGKDEPPYETSDFKTYDQWLARKAELWTSPAKWDRMMAENAGAPTLSPPSASAHIETYGQPGKVDYSLEAYLDPNNPLSQGKGYGAGIAGWIEARTGLENYDGIGNLTQEELATFLSAFNTEELNFLSSHGFIVPDDVPFPDYDDGYSTGYNYPMPYYGGGGGGGSYNKGSEYSGRRIPNLGLVSWSGM